MISKISSTPLSSFNSFNSIIFSQKTGNRSKNFNCGLEKDTVSLTGSSSEHIISEVVNMAFKKLNSSKYKALNKYKLYASTVGDVNLFIQEKVVGKEARLTLSNGDFNGHSFVNFDLKRSSNSEPKILPFNNEMEPSEAAKLINLYLK